MTWTWERIADSRLLSVLNGRMKLLEQHLGTMLLTKVADAKVYTTDATVTTLATEAVPVSQSLGLSGTVVGRRTGGSAGTAEDAAYYAVHLIAKNAAGTATIIGSSVTVIGESQAGWDCAVSASGGNVLVRVTGAANNDVTWTWARTAHVVHNNT